MTTELVKFNNEEFGEITTIEIDGEVWFLGKDITNILGYTNPTKAFKDHVDEEDRKTLKFKASNESLKASLWSGNDYSDKTLINESGIYALIFGSKLESAKRFKKWVTSEVLPSIRKTGAYGEVKQELSEKDQLRLKLFSNDPVEVAAAHKTLVELETRPLIETIEEQRPLVDFASRVGDAGNAITIGAFAKALREEKGIKIGRNILFQRLREFKVLDKKNLPYQKFLDKGWFKVIEKTMKVDNDEDFRLYVQTLITGKGQVKVYDLLKIKGVI